MTSNIALLAEVDQTVAAWRDDNMSKILNMVDTILDVLETVDAITMKPQVDLSVTNRIEDGMVKVHLRPLFSYTSEPNTLEEEATLILNMEMLNLVFESFVIKVELPIN